MKALQMSRQNSSRKDLKIIVKSSDDFIYKEDKIFKIFFMACQLILGHDFGYISVKYCKSRAFIKTLCFIQCLVMIFRVLAIEWFVLDLYDDYAWTGFIVTKYFLNTISFLTVKSKALFRSFLRDLRVLDKALGRERERDVLKYVFVAGMCGMWAYRTWTVGTGRVSVQKLKGMRFIVLPMALSIEVVKVMNVYVFCAFSYRIRCFVRLVKRNDARANCHTYKMLADLCETHKQGWDLIFFISMMINVPKLFVNIHSMVLKNVATRGNFEVSGQFIMQYLNLLSTLGPAFTAGRISTEVQNLLHVLHDKLIFERDPTKIAELVKFVQYVEARPLKFSVYKLIPLNATLVGIVMHFCATYIIVMVQFTYKA